MGRDLGSHRLSAHPRHPSRAVESVIALIREAGDGVWTLTFDVAARTERLVLPPDTQPERVDGLWRTTCFELFVRADRATGYAEFNLSPSGQWAAYRFDDYRQGQAQLPLALEPMIHARATSGNYHLLARIDMPAVSAGPWRIGLSAVIEESDGTKSYWALAHGDPDKPDFHDPACFALAVPAPDAP